MINVSVAYGTDNCYLYKGQREKAFEVFRQITSTDQWYCFGFVSAEGELKRIYGK